jgi:cytochrome oxidase Cu insertion factor (SCO1/SenC/PrrC family)
MIRADPPNSSAAAELMDDLMWGRGPIGGPFELVDHTGRRRTDADFRGRVLLIYFGYMFCPDICPTDLQAMAAAIDDLGPAGADVQPLFITIDPERDTPAELAQYVGSFHPRLIGLTGSVDEIRRVALRYKVWYAKADDPRTSTYIMDHSAFIYLIDVNGAYVGFFPPGTSTERLMKAIAPLVSRSR